MPGSGFPGWLWAAFRFGYRSATCAGREALERALDPQTSNFQLGAPFTGTHQLGAGGRLTPQRRWEPQTGTVGALALRDGFGTAAGIEDQAGATQTSTGVTPSPQAGELLPLLYLILET